MSQQTWAAALTQLQRQMTKATFEQWLQGTKLLEQADGVYRVAVQSEQAQEWLQHRLHDQVQRTLANLTGAAVTVEFVVAPFDKLRTQLRQAQDTATAAPDLDLEPITASEPETPPFGLTFAQETDFHSIKMDMGRWLPEVQYDNLFWSPYLDKAYLFYRHALMHWVKGLRKKDMALLDMAKTKNHWTPTFRLSYRKATQWLGKSNHKVIPGGVYECHRSDMHRRLEQCLAQCCEAHTPHDWQPEAEGGGRCYYWRPGLLHRLCDEQLLAIDISGTQRATIQLWRNLPLLTPHQVAQLNPFLQEEHDRWLDQHGHLFDLTLDEWLTISQLSLVPHLPGYDQRQLHGQPPANPFLQPCGGNNGQTAEKRNHVVANGVEVG